MPIDYTQLKTEITTDPLGMGYSGFIAVGDDTDVANLLNRTSGTGTGTVWRNDVTPREVINVIDPANFAAAQQIQISKVQLLFQAAPIDATLSGLRQNFSSIFSGTATVSGLTAISQRTGSRAEVLFGTGTHVSPNDVATALTH